MSPVHQRFHAALFQLRDNVLNRKDKRGFTGNMVDEGQPRFAGDGGKDFSVVFRWLSQQKRD